MPRRSVPCRYHGLRGGSACCTSHGLPLPSHRRFPSSSQDQRRLPFRSPAGTWSQHRRVQRRAETHSTSCRPEFRDAQWQENRISAGMPSPPESFSQPAPLQVLLLSFCPFQLPLVFDFYYKAPALSETVPETLYQLAGESITSPSQQPSAHRSCCSALPDKHPECDQNQIHVSPEASHQSRPWQLLRSLSDKCYDNGTRT